MPLRIFVSVMWNVNKSCNEKRNHHTSVHVIPLVSISKGSNAGANEDMQGDFREDEDCSYDKLPQSYGFYGL